MTKKIFALSLLLLLVFNLNITNAFATTMTIAKADTTQDKDSDSKDSTASAEKSAGEELNKQINQLKERIASRVAELNLVEKKGIIGTVSETSGNQITIKDLSGKSKFIDVDEITKFTSPDKEDSFGLSDLVKGTKISALGLYNKQSERLLARYINTISTPIYLSGRISKIDNKNFQITVASADKKQTTVDIEKVTSISIYTKEDGTDKYGFSKFEIGDRVLVTGYPGKDDPKILSSTRVLVLADLPKNPNIVIAEPTVIKDEDEDSKSTTPSKSPNSTKTDKETEADE